MAGNHRRDTAKNPNKTSPPPVMHRTDSEHDKQSKISGEVRNIAESGGVEAGSKPYNDDQISNYSSCSQGTTSLQCHPDSSINNGGALPRPQNPTGEFVVRLTENVCKLSERNIKLNDMLDKERDRNDQLYRCNVSLQLRIQELEITHNERDRNRETGAVNPPLGKWQPMGSKNEKQLKIKRESEKEDSKSHTLPLEPSQTSSRIIQQTDSTVKHSFDFPFMKTSDMYVCFELFHKNYIMHLDNKEDKNGFIDEFSAIAHEYVTSCNTQSDCAQKEVQELVDEFDNVKIEFLSPFELTDCKDIAKSKQQSSNLWPQSNETNSSSSSNTLQQVDNKVKHSLVFPFMTDSDIQVCFDYIHQSVETRWRYKKEQGMKFKNDVPKIANKYVETCKQLALGAQNKIRNLVDKYSKHITVEFLSPFNMKNLEEVVESVDKLSLTYVVYKFTCAGCKKTYIGKTTRKLNIQVNNHLRYNQKTKTAVNSHLESKVCREACKVAPSDNPMRDLDYCKKECFEVIDSAANDQQLDIKKALHIKWQRPDINKQEPRACLQLNYS